MQAKQFLSEKSATEEIPQVERAYDILGNVVTTIVRSPSLCLAFFCKNHVPS